MRARTPGVGLAAALAGPALVTAALLLIVEGWMAVRGQAPLVATGPSDDAFVAALRGQNVEAAFALVRFGQSVDAPLGVQDPMLTGGQAIRVRPLAVAVAAGNENGVAMLLSNGVHMDIDANRRAACLADQLGHRGMADDIRRASRQYPTVACPSRADSPLRPYAE